MNQTGNSDSETSSNTTEPIVPTIKEQVDGEIQKTNKYLENFEELIGLTASLNQNTIEQARCLLMTDWQDFKEMDAEEIAINAVILTDYGMTIQRIINREKATIHWAKERLKNVEQHTIFHKNLGYRKSEAELRLMRIENLHFSIKNLADKLEWLSKLKGKID